MFTIDDLQSYAKKVLIQLITYYKWSGWSRSMTKQELVDFILENLYIENEEAEVSIANEQNEDIQQSVRVRRIQESAK